LGYAAEGSGSFIRFFLSNNAFIQISSCLDISQSVLIMGLN